MSTRFKYRARDGNGRLVKGLMEAERQESVIAHLADQGLVAVNIRKVRDWSSVFSQPVLFKVGVDELAVITRQLGDMFKAGIPLLQCLRVIAEQLENPVLEAAVEQVRGEVEAGSTLWQAISQCPEVFPPLYVQMVRSGELGGFLGTALERLTLYLEREHEIKARIRQACIYPVLVTGLALLVVLFMISFVMPNFTHVFADAEAELPWLTRFLLVSGTFIRQYFLWIMVLLALLVFVWWLVPIRGKRGLVDRLILQMPLLGKVNRKLIAARFCRTMGTLVRSGVPVLAALDIAQEVVGNQVVAHGIEQARSSIREGENISTPLDRTGVFEPMVIQMLVVGEETGTLDEMLVRSAEYYESEVTRLVDTLIGLLEPALILVVAILVGLVVIGTVLPMFQAVGLMGV